MGLTEGQPTDPSGQTQTTGTVHVMYCSFLISQQQSQTVYRQLIHAH